MATAYETLVASRDTLAARYALAMTKGPDYAVDGDSYQWSKHLKDLGDELERINKLINKMSPSGPPINISQAET